MQSSVPDHTGRFSILMLVLGLVLTLIWCGGCPYGGDRFPIWRLQKCTQPIDSAGPLLQSPDGISCYRLKGTFDDYVFVADPPASAVWVMGPGGEALTRIGADSGQAKLDWPTSVAVARLRSVGGHGMDSAASIYVCDSHNHRICKFTRTGQFLASWGAQGSSSGMFSFPRGVDTDLNGRVYVLDSGNSRVAVFDSLGTLIRQWGSTGTAAGQFRGAVDLIVGYGHNFESAWVAVADAGNNRVQFFDTAGTYLSSVNQLNDLSGIGEGGYDYPYSAAAISKQKKIYFCFPISGSVVDLPITEVESPSDYGFGRVTDKSGKKYCLYSRE